MREITENRYISTLTTDSVTVISQRLIDINGVQEQIGVKEAIGYPNSESGRKKLQETESVENVTAVMALWGDTPTVTEEKTE